MYPKIGIDEPASELYIRHIVNQSCNKQILVLAKFIKGNKMNKDQPRGNDLPSWFYESGDIADIEVLLPLDNYHIEEISRGNQNIRSMLPIIYLFDQKKKAFVLKRATLGNFYLLDPMQWQQLRLIELESLVSSIQDHNKMDSQHIFSPLSTEKRILKTQQGLCETFLHRRGFLATGGRSTCFSFGILFRIDAHQKIQCMSQFSKPKNTSTVKEKIPPHLFSRRETEILLCMSEGMSSKLIASKLNISEFTVINHRKNMMDKSGMPNATSLVTLAIRQGII